MHNPIKILSKHKLFKFKASYCFLALQPLITLKPFQVQEMQTTSLSSFVLLPIPCSKRQSASSISRNKKSFIYASKRDSFGKHYDGKLVDENMIVLRMRIREIEMVETKNETPSGWSEWEKKYFENYDLDVCDAVGLLQRMLMNTRPGLVVGIIALIMLSMSMSMSLLVVQLVELAKGNII